MGTSDRISLGGSVDLFGRAMSLIFEFGGLRVRRTHLVVCALRRASGSPFFSILQIHLYFVSRSTHNSIANPLSPPSAAPLAPQSHWRPAAGPRERIGHENDSSPTFWPSDWRSIGMGSGGVLGTSDRISLGGFGRSISLTMQKYKKMKMVSQFKLGFALAAVVWSV